MNRIIESLEAQNSVLKGLLISAWSREDGSDKILYSVGDHTTRAILDINKDLMETIDRLRETNDRQALELGSNKVRMRDMEAENKRLDDWNGDMGHEMKRQIAVLEAENAELRRQLAETWQPVGLEASESYAYTDENGVMLHADRGTLEAVFRDREIMATLDDNHAFCRRQSQKP